MVPSHQVQAAMGVTIEYDLHYYTRRLKAGELTFRNGMLYRELIAKNMGL